MIHDLNKKQINEKKIYDYCIVGAGLTGIIIANELIAKFPKSKVLIIEYGNKKFDHDIISTIFGETKKINKSLISGLGGSTNTWAQTLSSPSIDELKEFKITLDKFKYYQKKLKKKYNLFSKFLNDHNPLFTRTNKPLRIKNFLNTNKYDLVINGYVHKIHTNYSKVKHIRILSSNKSFETKIFAKNYILCNNSYSIIQLLLNSIKSKDLKINNLNIGKGITNHPILHLGHFTKGCKKINKFTINNNLNYYQGIRFFRDNKSHLSFYKLTNFNLNLIIFYFKQLIKKSLIFFGFLNEFKYLKIPFILKNFFKSKYIVLLFLEMSNLEGFAKLANKKNYLGNNLLKLNFSRKYLYQTDYNFLYKKLFENYQINIHQNNNDKLLSFDSSHHMGGLKIGNSQNNSVINFNFKYHRLNNLFIISNGIFPKHSSINPSYFLSILSLFFVDKLFSKLKRSKYDKAFKKI